VDTWTDIVAISAGGLHTVGLKADGTVVATGNNDEGQCNVSYWTDIVAIAAGSNHTLGLKADGTVVVAGDKRSEKCNVSDWTDIKIPEI
jgi:alpha-tubulin suppressor-like RCC1 family protein